MSYSRSGNAPEHCSTLQGHVLIPLGRSLSLYAREKTSQKARNQIFGKHILKHLEVPSEGPELASWTRHFLYGMPSPASARSDRSEGTPVTSTKQAPKTTRRHSREAAFLLTRDRLYTQR
jgi:hypothetical protein